MGAWENRGGGAGGTRVVGEERARGESLTGWEAGEIEEITQQCLSAKGRKKEERDRSHKPNARYSECKVCTPVPPPP